MTQKSSYLQSIVTELRQALTENPEVKLERSILNLAVVAVALQHPDYWKEGN